MKKRIMGMLVAMLMVFAMMPMTAGTVFAESDTDTEAPVIDLDSMIVTLPEGKDKVSVGDTITWSVNISDDRQLDWVRMGLYPPITGPAHNNIVYVEFEYAGGDVDSNSGLWTGSFEITDQTESGVWQIEAISAHDANSNWSAFTNNQVRNYGNTDLSGFNFEVEGTSNDPDVTAPVIDLDSMIVTLPEGKDKVSVGDTITWSVNISDDRQLDWVRMGLYPPVTGPAHNNIVYVEFEYAGGDVDSNSGLWTGSFEITDQTESGIWQIEAISAHDTNSNWSAFTNNQVRNYGNTDLSGFNFEVTSPECPLDLTTEGYSMMLDGAGATTTFGGNYYVNTTEETVTPTVKVRFDADDGTWTTLSPRKYTLKYEKKTGESSWEDYTSYTFGVDESGTATYRVSATGKESLYYTGTVGPVEFNVIKKHKVTFDTRGGSIIDPQYVVPGEHADKPDDPAKEDSFFDGWYADEDLTELFDFETAVNEDITIFAKWVDAAMITVGVYDKTNSKSGQGGSYTINAEDMTHTLDRHYVPVGSEVTLVATPAEGYRFEGWTLGNVTGSGEEIVIQPMEGDYIYNIGPTLQFEAGPAYSAYAICAVFREISDTPPEIDISTLQILLPENRQGDRKVMAGDTVSVSVKITDNGTIKKALAWFLHDHENIPGDDESYIVPKTIRLSRQDGDIWTGEFKIDKNTHLGEWEFAYIQAEDDNSNESCYYNSGGYYEEDFSPYTDLSEFNFTVEEGHIVTFESNGGSEVLAQAVISGNKAIKPEDPVREGWHFAGTWYTDEAMTTAYDFNTSVTQDITLYADWIAYMAIGIYNQSNPDTWPYKYECGTVDIEMAEASHPDAKVMNFTVKEGSVKFTAKPAEGYIFKGFYKGIVGSSYYVEKPADERLSAETVYTCEAGEMAICAVFECSGHQFEDKIQKATLDTDGSIGHVCMVCGTEEAGTTIPKVSSISLEGTSFDYTGKAIEPLVTVATAEGELASYHYTIGYSNNVDPGKAAVKVTLIGEYYEGEKELIFTINPSMYTVTFTDGQGTTLKTEMVEQGKAASAPTYPTREGFTFDGWDKDFSNITANLTVTAKWKKNESSSTDDPSSKPADNPSKSEPVSIAKAKVVLSKKAFTYNGKVQKPVIKTIGGKKLKSGTDYTAKWSNAKSKKAGKYTVTITGKGNYTGQTKATYKINKASNPLKIKGKKVTVTAKGLKNKNKTLTAGRVITITKKGKGSMKYTLSFAKKGKANFKKYFTINAKKGSLTVKKGLEEGTYKVKVKVKAAGNKNYKASKVKTVTISITVK